MSQESGCGFAGSFIQGVNWSWRLFKTQLGRHLFMRLLARIRPLWAVGQLPYSISCHMGLSIGQLTTVLSKSASEKSQRKTALARQVTAYCNLFLEVIPHHLHSMLFDRTKFNLGTEGHWERKELLLGEHQTYSPSKVWIYVRVYFLAALGLRCCTQVFSSCSEEGLLLLVVLRLLTEAASLGSEHRL